MSDIELTLKKLDEAVWGRYEAEDDGATDWGPENWALAVQGPTGYIAHLMNQRRRRVEIGDGEIFDEIADAIIYLSLLCHSMDGDLATVITRKFNETSKKIKSPVQLPVPKQAKR